MDWSRSQQSASFSGPARGSAPVHMPAIKVPFAEWQALLAQQGVDHAEVEKEVGQRVLLQKGAAIQRHSGFAGRVVNAAFRSSAASGVPCCAQCAAALFNKP